MIILPTAYFGPAAYYHLLLKHETIRLEKHESFAKQSFRNRCEIYGANGKLKLIVPLQKWKNQSPIHQIRISKEEDWQSLHWKSIQSAYRSSPYFEFYESELAPLFNSAAPESLLEFNQLANQKIIQLINAGSQQFEYTESYQEQKPDWRMLLNPKNKKLAQVFRFPHYLQVFEDRAGFLPNLSILDVLFNLGPESKNYLSSIELIQNNHGEEN